MPSYIPGQIKQIRDRVEAKLDRELVARLEQYCEYLQSDRDYVIAQVLSVALRKDKPLPNGSKLTPCIRQELTARTKRIRRRLGAQSEPDHQE